MPVSFDDKAIKEYFEWQNEDSKMSDKINKLITDIQRNGLMNGIGHPEKLKRRIGEYSRHITDEHRLVYKLDNNGNLFIISCVGHYE